MGLMDGLSEQLQPHVVTLNETLAGHGYSIRELLEKIESNTKAGIGDRYLRLYARGEYTAGVYELGVVPRSEMWLVQSITTNGVINASPHYVIRSGGYLIASVIKEGIGSENPGGDIVCLPGEIVVWEPETTGKYEFVLVIVRRKLHHHSVSPNLGPKGEQLGQRNTHDPERDELPNKMPQPWTPTNPEVVNTVGRPASVISPGLDPLGV